MTFVDTLMSFLSGAMSFIADGFTKLFHFLAVPLGWIVSLIEGIWYFITCLFQVLVAFIDIFVALFQFLGALSLGFFRTITGLLTIDYSKTPIHYPSETQTGMSVVLDNILAPTGFLTVVPMICLAIVWLLFVIAIFGLLGGEKDS